MEVHLKENDTKLPVKVETPIQILHQPEHDISTELKSGYGSYYQSLIVILRWMVELERVDICLEVSIISSHLVLLLEGHLEQLYYVFVYLKK